MSKTFLLIFAAFVAFQANAQQAATPQPAQQQTAATTPTPCPIPGPTQPHKQGWLEKKARALACKQNSNMCDLPSSPNDFGGTTPAAKPCTQTPAPKQPVTPPQVPNAKPALVCPPKTVLIANTPYCLAADHTTVDAIPLPANQPLPAAPQH
jgi:hypothetical protein